MTADGLDLSRAAWRRSTHSTNGGSCVEVAAAAPGVIAVRDSKDPAGPKLAFTSRQWTLFTSTVKRLSRAAAGFPLSSSDSRASFPPGFQLKTCAETEMVGLREGDRFSVYPPCRPGLSAEENRLAADVADSHCGCRRSGLSQ